MELAAAQAQIAQQSSDLEAARATEQQLGELAAQLGCIGTEGQLLRERLQTTTRELVQARESEATYQGWLDDVKRMMAEGEEDGLAMALCQNMQANNNNTRRRCCDCCDCSCDCFGDGDCALPNYALMTVT